MKKAANDKILQILVYNIYTECSENMTIWIRIDLLLNENRSKSGNVKYFNRRDIFDSGFWRTIGASHPNN